MGTSIFLLMIIAVSLVTSKSVWKRNDDIFNEIDVSPEDNIITREELAAYLASITDADGTDFLVIANSYIAGVDGDSASRADGALDRAEFTKLGSVICRYETPLPLKELLRRYSVGEVFGRVLSVKS